MTFQPDNPYASPSTVLERQPTETPSTWRNRFGGVGFFLSLLFPVVALASLGAIFMEDEFGVVRWRVHRFVRMMLFQTSKASLAAVAISLFGLAFPPRRLALYGLLVGLLGSLYWVLATLGLLRR